MKRYSLANFFVLGYIALSSMLHGCSGGESFAGGAKWPSRRVTYQIVESGRTTDLDMRPISPRPLEQAEADAYREAISKWNAVSPVQLVEDKNAGWPGAEIIIYGVDSLQNGAVGEALPHVSDAGYLDRVRCLVPRAPHRPPREVRLAALHEMGHALGLDHTHEPRAVMYPRWLLQGLVEVSSFDVEKLLRMYKA